MATINNLISSGYSASNSKTTSEIKNEIKAIQDKISSLDKDSSISSADRQDQKKKYLEEISELRTAASDETTANMQGAVSAASNLVSSMFGGNTANGAAGMNQDGLDLFFGAGASLASLRAVNSARLDIESRARTLVSEIAMDKRRGVDTSAKQEKLTNLTSSLQIMDDNLNKNIEGALDTSDTGSKVKEKSVIDSIKDDLAANQAKLDKEFTEKKETGDSAEKTDSDK